MRIFCLGSPFDFLANGDEDFVELAEVGVLLDVSRPLVTVFELCVKVRVSTNEGEIGHSPLVSGGVRFSAGLLRPWKVGNLAIEGTKEKCLGIWIPRLAVASPLDR